MVRFTSTFADLKQLWPCNVTLGSHALVVQTEKNDVLAYTLPYLELVSTVQLPNASPLLVFLLLYF